MKEMKNLKRVAQEELEKLDAKYANLSEFTAADAEMYKCLTMALEKQLRIEQIQGEMHGEEWTNEEPGMSGRKPMHGADGRFISGTSYADGYSRGYSEAMNQQSGHWPMPPYRY